MNAFRCLVLCTAMVPVLSFAARGDYGGSFDLDSLDERQSEAVDYYEQGLKDLDAARDYEEKAAEYPEAHRKRDKYLAEAREAYEDAIDEYKVALNHDNHLYPVYASLGFALRKVDRLRESEIAYRNALFIKPDYAPAIEYLAETHLYMRELDRVKSAYKQLVDMQESEYIAQLSEAIGDWLQRQNVAGDPELRRFARWAEQPDAVTGQDPSP